MEYKNQNFLKDFTNFDTTKNIFYKIICNEKKILDSDIIGFSIHSNYSLINSLIIAKIIKQKFKNKHIVFGGQMIQTIYKESLKEGQMVTKSISEVCDGVIVGDGEMPMAKLIYKMGKNLSLKNIEGYINTQNKNKFTKSQEPIFSKTINLKADFNGFKIKFIPLCVSRGCYWGKCTFCSIASDSKCHGYKIEKVEKILEIIKKYKKKCKKFIFYDDSIPPYYLKEFSEKLIEKKYNIEWYCQNLCLDPAFIESDVVKLMKKSGCKKVNFGLESMSPRILKLMNKIHTAEIAKKVLNIFKKEGIKVNLFIIFGFPSETKKDLMTTVNFLRKNKKLYNNVSSEKFILKRNSHIFKYRKKFAIDSISNNQYGIFVNYKTKTQHNILISNLRKKLLKEKIISR